LNSNLKKHPISVEGIAQRLYTPKDFVGRFPTDLIAKSKPKAMHLYGSYVKNSVLSGAVNLKRWAFHHSKGI